jgi:CheY-like chemotaxis protein
MKAAVNATPLVLIVDDCEDDVLLTTRAIAEIGSKARVVVATGGEQAIQACAMYCGAGCAPDLVVLDLVLPGMGGIEVLRRLRENRLMATVPVLILSGLGSPAAEAISNAAGASAYVLKPNDFDEYLSIVGRAVCDLIRPVPQCRAVADVVSAPSSVYG